MPALDQAGMTDLAQSLALNALAVRAKSRGEISAHLKRRGVTETVITEVCNRLERSGLLNDLEFARAWSSSRLSSKKISKRVLAQELRKKEVSEELILVALDEIDDDSEYAAAYELASRKFRSLRNYTEDVQNRRISSALARKGYNFGIISRVLNQLRLES